MKKDILLHFSILLNLYIILAQNYDYKSGICFSSEDNNYILKSEKGQCILNECIEYPEISEGCIICKDNLTEYKQKNKCQMCKYGYFKTKEEKCIYCGSEKYDGPACRKCGYENGTDNIICIEYPEIFYFVLSSDKKCYACSFDAFCKKCVFEKNINNNKESLKCLKCNPPIYLNSDGKCIFLAGFNKQIPYCYKYYFTVGNVSFSLYDEEMEIESDIDENNNFNDFKNLFRNGFNHSTINSICIVCDDGYILNDKGNCEQITYDNCTFNSILQNYDKIYDNCYGFCNYYHNHYYYNYDNGKVLIQFNGKNINDFYNIRYNKTNDYDIRNFSQNIKTCLSNSGDGDENSPKHLKYCSKAKYIPENMTYICIVCINGYNYNNDTNLCYKEQKMKNNKYPCIIENIGNNILPNYCCTNPSYYREQFFTLIEIENEKKDYIEREGDLEGCLEAKADTYYININYN